LGTGFKRDPQVAFIVAVNIVVKSQLPRH